MNKPIHFGDYFIIESITRGTFREWDYDEDKPRFSTSGARGDADKCMRFSTLEEAEKMLAKIHSKLRTKNCYIADARYSFNKVGTTEHRYMVRGSWYGGPNEDGADKDGYLIFYDIVTATNEEDAIADTAENYGEHNTIRVHGIAKDKAAEEAWLARNPS